MSNKQHNYEIFELAKKYSNNKNFDLALKYFDKCRNFKEFRLAIIFEKAKIFYEIKNYVKSKKYCLQYLKQSSDSFLKYNMTIILSKIYKNTNKIDKAISLLDNLDKTIIKDLSQFNNERLELSYCMFNDFFRVHEFSGNKMDLSNEFAKIKQLVPENNKHLFYISRISNFLHDYKFTEQIINKYYNTAHKSDNFYNNAVLNEFEISKKRTVLKSKPRSMWIATSSKCNISCQMCHANDKYWELSDDNIKDIYSYMPYLEHIVWWGGEPTISNIFYRMLEYSLQYKNIKHTIITNGQHMPKKLIYIIVKHSIEVVFSIDSVNKKKYESIRKGASFDKLEQNISRLSKVLQNNLIKFNVVTMKKNLNELTALLRFAKKYNVKSITFIPLCAVDMGEDKLNSKDINAINQVVKASKEVKIFNSSDIINCSKDKQKNKCVSFCHIPWTDITVSFSGFLCYDNLCSFFGGKKFILNNKNMLKYWNSSFSQNFRNNIIKNHYCSEFCPKANIKIGE